MTKPCKKGLGVLLVESVQQGNRPVSRDLLPLPVPFPENEHVESGRPRSLSRAVRSRVVRRVGWQGWANDGVRSMTEIYSKTSASEAGSRSSSLQLASLSRICSASSGLVSRQCRISLRAPKRAGLARSCPGIPLDCVLIAASHLQSGQSLVAMGLRHGRLWWRTRSLCCYASQI